MAVRLGLGLAPTGSLRKAALVTLSLALILNMVGFSAAAVVVFAVGAAMILERKRTVRVSGDPQFPNGGPDRPATQALS
jgi:hypothetical protein